MAGINKWISGKDEGRMDGLQRLYMALVVRGRECVSYSSKIIASCQPKYWMRYHQPRIVFMTGMPRSGTTLAKRYLGEHPELVFAPSGTYQEGWAFALKAPKNKIVIFKNTRTMPFLKEIYSAYGNKAWFLCIVRDPRDELMSLFETDIHPEIPRNEMFWTLWKERYLSFLDFVRSCSHKGTRVALVRYEDLVLHSIKTKALFLEWLDLPPAELGTCYQTIPEIALGPKRGEDWKAHQNGTVHTESLGRWRQESDPLRLKIILHCEYHDDVMQLMSLLGYGEGTNDPGISVDGLTVLRG